jgi:transcriptional regulator with XRE-family HTH domain
MTINLEKSFNIALASRDMKKKDLANLLKVTPSYISQVTRNGSLSVSKLQELATALDYKLWEFIKLSED